MAITVGEVQVLIEARTTGIRNDLNRLDQRLKRFAGNTTRSVGAANRGFISLGSTLRRLGPILAAVGFGLAARDLFKLSEATILLRNQLVVVTDGAKDLDKAIQGVRAVANETRTGIEPTITLFRRLSLATRTLGISQDDTLRVTRTINQAIIASGVTAREAEAGIIQLSQGLQGGALRSDELRSVFEQLPAVVDIVAKSLGITFGEVRRLGLAGKLTTELLVSAFQDQATEVDALFKKLTPTVGQAFSVMRNELFIFIDALNQTFNLTGNLGQTILNVATNLGTGLAQATATGLRGIAKLLDGFAILLGVLDSIGIDVNLIKTVFEINFGAIKRQFTLLVAAIKLNLNLLRTAATGIISTVTAAGNAVGVVSDRAAIRAKGNFERARTALGASLIESGEALAAVVTGAVDDGKRLVDELTNPQNFDFAIGVADTANNLRKGADSIVDAVGKLRRLGLEPDKAIPVPDPEAGGGKAELKLAKQLDSLRDRLRREQIQREQGDRAAAIRDVQLQITETARLADQATSAFSKNAAEDILILLDEQLQHLQRFFGEATVEGLRDGFQAFLSNDMEGVVDSLLGILEKETAETLERAFDKAIQAFESLMKSALESAGDVLPSVFGKDGVLGGLLSENVVGSLIGIGARLLQGLNEDAEVSATAANVKSAVTSTQAVRGVVAGPTQIGIARVGESIAEAFEEPTRLLDLIEINTRLTAQNTGSGADAGGAALGDSGGGLA